MVFVPSGAPAILVNSTIDVRGFLKGKNCFPSLELHITANIFESGPRPTPWKCYNNVSFHIFQYLYLLFSDDELISLDEWVFNTEAHPLPIKGHNKFYRSSNDIDTGAIKVKKSDILAASADAVLLH